MTVRELDVTPRLSGRAQRPPQVLFVRDLKNADLALLASERGIKAPLVQRLRDRHHALAKCLANNMSNSEASAITGYDPSRISILKNDPSFQDLVTHYRDVKNAASAEFHDRAETLSLTAMDIIQERLEDTPDEISIPTAIEIIKLTADRTGHAPVQRNVNLNINTDTAQRLNAARARLKAISDNSGGPSDA